MKKNINKQKIARSFLKGKDTYDSNARIQRRVSEKLVEKLGEYKNIHYGRVLEIGCCTGTLTDLLLQNFKIDTLYLNDLVSDFYEIVLDRLDCPERFDIVPFFGDIETLVLPEDLDLVISSATFQWLVDLDALFKKVAGSLQPGGYFIFTIFGPGTLAEFREITGVGLDYMAVGVILDLIEKHFTIEEEESCKDQLFFSTPREVLRHLQATGVGGVTEYKWTTKKLYDFEKRYSEQFGSSSGIPVTYMSSYVVATKKGK